MEDKELPKAIGESILPPIQLSNKQEELCRRLDELHSYYNLKFKPSNMLRGAIFVSRNEFRENQDWMAQAANSLREILYPFYTKEIKDIPTNKLEVFKKHRSVRVSDQLIIDMGRVYGQLNGLTHHGNVKKNNVNIITFTDLDFENLFRDFERVLSNILSRQLDIHREIDDILLEMSTQSTSIKN